MPLNLFERRWLSADDARRVAKWEGYTINEIDNRSAHRGKKRIVLRCLDCRWYYWQHLVEERPSRSKKKLKQVTT
jgi:hypothetical protein